MMVSHGSRGIKGAKICSIIHLIACGVFRPALKFLRLEEKYPQLRITFLPSKLHLYPRTLKKNLLREIVTARKQNERPLLLYGYCFPGIEEICTQNCADKVPGLHCYEMLLGSDRYDQIMAKTAGTYFLERELIVNFKDYCLDPLELYDNEIRKSFFKHYKKVIYVRQLSDPDLEAEANELAGFLNLSLEIIDADYTHLEKRLIHLIHSGIA
ncbi:MAG: hypothetical protein DRH24_13740 [Deltaproteobacteria bacterium]|nr:MAG: hypothetical protein DRH24_13740 [Deltaproteobacteria bacterium]